MSEPAKKHSYTITCSSAFRDAIDSLARQRRVNVADLARSVVLVVPPEEIAAYPDPGEPDRDDRETVILKSGAAKGRPWRRKPRLQVRMAPGHEVSMVRRALAIALAVESGEMAVRLAGDEPVQAAVPEPAPEPEPQPQPQPQPQPENTSLLREAREEMERLRAMVSALSFDPLPDGVNNREDALHVLGFPPGRIPDLGSLRARFRMLATIHHPDGDYGNHQRMSQLNAAMDLLRRGAA